MEFLFSPPIAQAKTVLALLICKDEVTCLLLYTWEERAPLRYVRLDDRGFHRLPDRDRMPLLLIPSRHDVSFTLVSESGLTMYKDVLSSNMQCCHISIPQTFPTTFLGSCRSPLWVQWAKPHRHEAYRNTNDDFFLVREDGKLDYYEVRRSAWPRIHVRTFVGSLNVAVDSAFAILEGPAKRGPDICVVGGDMTDGAIFQMLPRLPVQQIQTLSNLAPLQDMLILDKPSPIGYADRIFVSAGKGVGYGAVAEIRRGLEARIGLFAELEDSSMATGLWVLPEAEWVHLTLLVSYPLQTLLLRINLEKLTLEVAEDSLLNQGLQLNSQTLAFAVIRNSFLVQITPSAVLIFSAQEEIRLAHRGHTHCPVSIATVDPEHMLIATVAVINDVFQVLLSSMDVTDTGISINDYSKAYSMFEEPSCILIAALNRVQLLIVGTIVGTVHVLEIKPGEGLRLISRYEITILFPRVEPSAICSLNLLTDSDMKPPALACGTRNGWVLGMTIAQGMPTTLPAGVEAGDFLEGGMNDISLFETLQPENAQHVGQTSVNLIPDPARRCAALLFCDFNVYRLSYSLPGSTDFFQLLRIWFTEITQVCVRQ